MRRPASAPFATLSMLAKVSELRPVNFATNSIHSRFTDELEAAPPAEPSPVPKYKPAPKLLSLPLPQITLCAPRKKSNLEYHPEKPALDASPAKKKQEASVDSAPKYVPGQPSVTNGEEYDDWQAVLEKEIDEQMQVEIEEQVQNNDEEQKIDTVAENEEDQENTQLTDARDSHKKERKPSKERERDIEKKKIRELKREKIKDRDRDRDREKDKEKSKERDREKEKNDRDKRKSSHNDKERSKERNTSSSSSSKHKSSSSSSSSKKSSSSDKHRDDKSSSSRHKSSSSSSSSKSHHHKSSSSSSRSKTKRSSSSSKSAGTSKSEPEADKDTEAAVLTPAEPMDDLDDMDFDFEADTSEGEIVRQCEMIFDEMEKKFAQMHKDEGGNANPESSRKRKAPSPNIDTFTEAATAALQKRRVAHENADKITPHLAPSAAMRKPNHVRNAMQAIFNRRAELRRQEKLQAEASAEQVRQAQERVRQAQEELRQAKVNSNLTPLISRSALTPPVRSGEHTTLEYIIIQIQIFLVTSSQHSTCGQHCGHRSGQKKDRGAAGREEASLYACTIIQGRRPCGSQAHCCARQSGSCVQRGEANRPRSQQLQDIIQRAHSVL